MTESSFLVLFFLFGILLSEYVQLISDRGTFLGSLFDRSHCDHCKKEIPWYALIPFFGRLIVGSKCVYCKKPVSSKYLWFEILFSVYWALVMVALWYTEPFSYAVYGIGLLAVCTTGLLAYEDNKNYSVPIPWLAAWVISYVGFWYTLGHRALHFYDLLGMFAVLLLSLVVVKATKRDASVQYSDLFGAADIIVLGVLSVLVGFQGVTVVLVASLVTAVGYLLIKKSLKLGEKLPLLTMMLPWALLGLILLI